MSKKTGEQAYLDQLEDSLDKAKLCAEALSLAYKQDDLQVSIAFDWLAEQIIDLLSGFDDLKQEVCRGDKRTLFNQKR